MLRVVAGKYRGRKLEQPPREITRPTMDRVKESIFNMIQFDIEGSIVLDLFAGSGSLSIECVSRGAMKAIAVDKSDEAHKVMEKNMSSLGITNITRVKSDVVTYVKSLKGTKFDFIFMDPPFAMFEIYLETFKAIKEADILKNTGYIILETMDPSKITIPEGFVVSKNRKYGISHVLFLSNII